MVKWLLEVIDSYDKLQERDVRFNSLQWIMVLLFVLWHLEFLKENLIDTKYYQILFRELCVLPHSEINSSKWSHFSAVEENILRSNQLSEIFVTLLKYMHTKARQPMPEILFSFPMLHFAQGLCTPFADSSVLPIVSPDSKFTFYHFKNVTTKWFVNVCVFVIMDYRKIGLLSACAYNFQRNFL